MIIGACRNPAYLIVVVLLAAAAAGLGAGAAYFELYFEKKEIHAPQGRLVTRVPRETASWISVGNDRREEAEVESVLGTTNYLIRMYKLKDTGEGPAVMIDLHLAYYTGNIGPVPHVPDRCFVGGGMQIGEILGDKPLGLDASSWRVVDEGAKIFEARVPDEYSDRPGTYVRLPRDAAEINIRTMKFLNPGGTEVYSGYFFVANGGWVSRAEQVRLLAFDLRSVYAYYLKIQVTSTSVSSGEELVSRAGSLLSELMPEIMRCVPDWVEVEAGRYPGDATPEGRTR